MKPEEDQAHQSYSGVGCAYIASLEYVSGNVLRMPTQGSRRVFIGPYSSFVMTQDALVYYGNDRQLRCYELANLYACSERPTFVIPICSTGIWPK